MLRLRRDIFAVTVVLTGFAGIIGQIVLLRELMVSVYGNELSIGIILANWLIIEAVGSSFLGRTIERVRAKTLAFVILQIVFSIFLPLAVYGARVFKQAIGLTAGEGIGIVPMFLATFFIILPVSLSHGALFTFSCRIYSMLGAPRKTGSHDASPIGKVYFYETVGTIAGGVAANFLIQNYLSFEICFMVAAVNMLMCLVLLNLRMSAKQVPEERIASVVVFLLLIGCFFSWRNASSFNDFSLRQEWKGQVIVHNENSVYGNITIARSAEQYTFYMDGLPTITVPTPDIASREEFVHMSMLFHPEPKDVLIISGGAGGVINEVLKHGVRKVDYAELDPLIIKLLKKYPTELTEKELSDDRVRIKHVDGRLFLRGASDGYDLILVGLSNPSNLALNRFFTKEFFLEARRKLKDRGVFAITSPGSLTYLTEELGKLNGCLIRTLRSAFRCVRVIPGDFNLFLASDSEVLATVTADLLKERLNERRPAVRLITPQYIDYKLDEDKLKWFLSSIDETAGINRDFLPLGFFYSLSNWNAVFSPYMGSLFKLFCRLNLGKLFIIFLLLLLVSHVAYKRVVRLTFPFAIMCTGFSGMIFQLALIFAFQALFGYVYYRMVLLITAFMAGLAFGSLMITRNMERFKKDKLIFLRMEIGILILSIILPLVFILFSSHLEMQFLLQLFFIILCLVSGFLVGMEFPLANRMYLRVSGDLSSSAGFLYGSDLVGGWLGGILGACLFLPIIGLFGTCLTVTMAKVLCVTLVGRGVNAT